MPKPEDLKAYCELIPNAAERILRMAESTPKAELMLAAETVADTRQGRWMAYSLALLAMAVSAGFFIASVWAGPILTVAGGTFMALPVAVLVRSFLGR